MKKTGVFLDLGTMGGGSFQSLYELLGALNPERVRPLVVFVNHTRYLDAVREMGVPAHLVRDRAYSLEMPAMLRRRFEKIADKGPLRFPGLTRPLLRLVHGPLIRALVDIIRAERADLLYINGQVNRGLPALLAAEATGAACVAPRSRTARASRESAGLGRTPVDAYVSDLGQLRLLDRPRGPRGTTSRDPQRHAGFRRPGCGSWGVRNSGRSPDSRLRVSPDTGEGARIPAGGLRRPGAGSGRRLVPSGGGRPHGAPAAGPGPGTGIDDWSSLRAPTSPREIMAALDCLAQLPPRFFRSHRTRALCAGCPVVASDPAVSASF